MVISSSDIEYRLSGHSSNTNPNDSTGGGISNTSISSTTLLHNLFDEISANESTSGDIEYRWIYIYNGSSESVTNVRVYIKNNTGRDGSNTNDSSDGTRSIAIAKKGSKNSNPFTILESSAPQDTDSQGFVYPTSRTDTDVVELDDLDADDYQAICIRRQISANANGNTEALFTLEVAVESES